MKSTKLYRVILLTLLLLNQTIVLSQYYTKKSFEIICNELLLQNQNYHIKKELKGVILLEEPINQTYDLGYDSALNKHTKEMISKYGKNEIIKILKKETIPNLPLNKTIIIVDSTGFFSPNITYKDQGYYFKILKTLNRSSKTHWDLKLCAIKKEENSLILCFELFQTNYLIAFCFNYEKNVIDLSKVSIFKNAVSYE